jgi:hypothetical protein
MPRDRRDGYTAAPWFGHIMTGTLTDANTLGSPLTLAAGWFRRGRQMLLHLSDEGGASLGCITRQFAHMSCSLGARLPA